MQSSLQYAYTNINLPFEYCLKEKEEEEGLKYNKTLLISLKLD